MTRDGWIKLLRFLATGIGVGVWVASIYFSSEFFGVKNEKLFWVGTLIAVAVTMLELVWRKPGMKGNVTINILAVTAYLYGIITNTLGIMLAWGFNGEKASELYFFSNIDSLVLALFPGIILEVLAEPLVTWGLVGDAMADLLGNTVDMLNSRGEQSSSNNQSGKNNQNNNNRNHGNDQRNRHEPRNDDMEEDDGYIPLDHAVGREARQNMGRRPEPVYHPMSGGGGRNSNKKDRGSFRG